MDSSRCDLASLSAKDFRGFAGGAFGGRRGSWGFVGETGLAAAMGSSSEELPESSATAFSGSNTSFCVVFVVLPLIPMKDWNELGIYTVGGFSLA
jgi:hypothetical protein